MRRPVSDAGYRRKVPTQVLEAQEGGYQRLVVVARPPPRTPGLWRGVHKLGRVDMSVITAANIEPGGPGLVA